MLSEPNFINSCVSFIRKCIVYPVDGSQPRITSIICWTVTTDDIRLLPIRRSRLRGPIAIAVVKCNPIKFEYFVSNHMITLNFPSSTSHRLLTDGEGEVVLGSCDSGIGHRINFQFSSGLSTNYHYSTGPLTLGTMDG